MLPIALRIRNNFFRQPQKPSMACSCHLFSIISHLYTPPHPISASLNLLFFLLGIISHTLPTSTPPALPPNTAQLLCILWSQCQVHSLKGAFPAPRCLPSHDMSSCTLQHFRQLQVKFLLNVRFLLDFRFLEDRDARLICSGVSAHNTNKVKE